MRSRHPQRPHDARTYLDPRLLYIGSEASLSEVADHLRGQRGCSLPRLKARCAREGWVAQRMDFKQKVADRTAAILGFPPGSLPPEWFSRANLRAAQRLNAQAVRLARRLRAGI